MLQGVSQPYKLLMYCIWFVPFVPASFPHSIEFRIDPHYAQAQGQPVPGLHCAFTTLGCDGDRGRLSPLGPGFVSRAIGCYMLYDATIYDLLRSTTYCTSIWIYLEVFAGWIHALGTDSSVLGQAGVQPESKEGLPLDPTVQLAMDWPHAWTQVDSWEMLGASNYCSRMKWN